VRHHVRVGDLFPRDAMLRRVAAEPAVFLGAGRALLLQVAHPSVAQGVADHSEFQANPFKRLAGTLEATNAVVFGTDELAASVGRRISGVHDHVTGPGYHANDPALLLWVHATLVDTAITCFEKFVRPLQPHEGDELYEQSMQVAEVFGCPLSAQPATFSEFRAYFNDTAAGLRVSDVGRSLAHDIIWPALPIVPRPMQPILAPPLSMFRLFTVGLLPAQLRDQFGFSWGAKQQRRYRRVAALASAAGRVAPRSLRVAPTTAQARYLVRRANRRSPVLQAHPPRA
jgi:uncharacterized protein (DUF2236 family)